MEIEKKMAENAIEQMGLDRDESKIELHFESHDPTNVYKSLQLYVDQMGIQSPAGEVGAGLQSAIVVAIFRTYEELKKEGAVFAIEEPEVFLHPQKARYFSSVLQSLAEKGSQLLITTHSPIFVQIHNPESIAVVRRTNETGTVIEQTEMIDIAPDQRKELQLLSEFDSQRNELFFSKRAVFVEGNTEKVSIPLVFKALGFDINKENISIIECGGKTKIPLFVRVAKALHIPYVVIADHDINEIKEEWSDKRKEKQNLKNKNHKKWNKDIIDVAGEDKVFFLYPDFESELGLSKDESMKVEQALNMFARITKEDLPECLMKPIKYLMKL
jgi:predicted ATP-dependent endonuclease of OLD family